MKPFVVLNFARSGGTLLARILGADPCIVLVSEINPKCGATPDHKAVAPEIALKQQMKNWYGIHLEKDSFEHCMAELLAHCNRMNKRLVVRDWTYIDFVANEWNSYTPTYRFSIMDSLNSISSFNRFALVRDAIDVYLSVGGDVSEFAKSYLRYVEVLKENAIPILKYEDMVNSPNHAIKRICGRVGLMFDGDVFSYRRNTNVTGDIQLGSASRGIRAQSIKRMPRKWVPWKARREINASLDLRKANELLEYPVLYENDSMESFLAMAKRRFHNRVARLRC